jgi:PAS domain S-box-containing protein
MRRPRSSPDTTEVRAALRKAAQLAGGVVALAGLAALGGWWRDIGALTSLFSSWPSLKPNGAALLVLCGTSLVLTARPAPSPRAVWASRLCAAAALLLAGATLIEYLATVDLGIDHLLVHGSHLPAGKFGARVSPQTATSSLLAAAALLALNRPANGGASPAQVLALVAGSIPAVALLGYAFDVPELYRAPPHPSSGMSILAAIYLLVLTVGILAARPDIGPVALLTSARAGGTAARRLLLGLLAFLPVAFLIVLGQRLGFYEEAGVSALLAFFAFGEGVAVIFLTCSRLDLDDRERGRAEERLRASEAHTRGLFEQAAEGIFIADMEGRYTEVNGAACRLLDLPRERIVGQLISNFIAPEEVDRLRRTREDLLAGRSEVSEWTVKRGDGSWIAVEANTKILSDGRWQAFVRDITERRHNQTELERAQAADRRRYADEAGRRAWLMSIIDQMPEGVILLNDKGGIEAMNRALLSLTSSDANAVDVAGLSAMFELRRPDGSLVPTDDYPVTRALARGEVTTDREILVRLKDGRSVPTMGSAAPVRDPEGRITGAVAVIRDVTALKDLERLREEWASIIAHDLRQPVGAITLTAESLLGSRGANLSAQERRGVERIRSASKRLGRMIEDLLDFSRIEARRLSVRPRDVDFCAIIDAVVESHRETNAIRVVGEPGLRVSVDPDRVHQVLDNLISNAVKYGRPDAEIRLEWLDRGDRLEVVVTNQGAGIPAEDLPKLFSRFGRTRGAHAHPTPAGIGLGLYIARGLVEAHGGRIWAESVPGESTSFHLTLPIAPDRDGLHVEAGEHAPA